MEKKGVFGGMVEHWHTRTRDAKWLLRKSTDDARPLTHNNTYTKLHWQHKNTDNTRSLTTQEHWQHKNTDNTRSLTTQEHWQHKNTDNTRSLATQ
jgi:hypothetical protein